MTQGRASEGSFARGVLFILSAAFFFALMNLFVRLSGDLPTMQKALFRNLVAAVVAAVAFVRSGERLRLDRRQATTLFARSAFGTVGLVCNFYAVDHMLVADATILNKLAPFFVVLFSVPLLKETITRRDLLPVAIAFAGAVLVAKPSFSSEAIDSAVGFMGGLCAGIAYVCVRKLTLLGVPKALIVLCFSLFSCAVCLPFTVVEYTPMTPVQLALLLLCGVSAAIAQFSITAAYAAAPGREIAAFDYTQVVFVAVLSFVVLGEVPDALSLLGYALIIGAAVMRSVGRR